MDSNEFGGGAIRNELGYDLAKDIYPRDWRTFRIRLLRLQERGESSFDFLLLHMWMGQLSNIPFRSGGYRTMSRSRWGWKYCGVFLEPITELLLLTWKRSFLSLRWWAPFLIPQHPDKWGRLPKREVLFLDDDETPMPDIIWDSLSGSKDLSWLIANLYFFFQMTISMREVLSSASSSLYHWIDLRVWIILEKTVLCFLDSSVLCCGPYPWPVQGPLVALWVFQIMRKLDLILLIHLVWRLGGCFCHPDPSLYLCGCDSYSAGKLCLVSIPRNCSRYWWVRNLNHWLICPLCYCCLVAKSCLTLCDPWTVARQAPLSMGFSSQEYWSGLPLPSPRDLSDSWI